MKTVFTLLVFIIFSLHAAGEDFAVYGDSTNVSYPDKGVNCSFGQIHADQTAYWCWTDFDNKIMDHSFMNYTQMDNYYNSSGEGAGGGSTYSLSAYQEPSIQTEQTEPGIISGLLAIIQGLFS